jgi:hypothetical protein
MKEKALQEDSEPFKDAFAVLDEEFGPEVWRTKQGKPPILSPCSMLGVLNCVVVEVSRQDFTAGMAASMPPP